MKIISQLRKKYQKDANPIYKLFIALEFVQTIYHIELIQQFADVFLIGTAK